MSGTITRKPGIWRGKCHKTTAVCIISAGTLVSVAGITLIRPASAWTGLILSILATGKPGDIPGVVLGSLRLAATKILHFLISHQ